MNILSNIFIFSLFILFTPGIFIEKTKDFGYLLHSVLFLIVFYFILPIVNNEKEFYTIQVDGINNLVNLVDKYNKEKETNIDIQNEIKGTEDSGAECWNALGKTQKDLEVLKLQLNSYDGTWSNIESLEKEIVTYKEKIASLEKTIDSYKGSKDSKKRLTIQANNYKDQLAALQKQLSAFGDITSVSIKNLNNELDNLEDREQNLIEDKNRCTSKTPYWTRKVNDAQRQYDKKSGIIKKYRKIIANKDLCNLEVTMTEHCPFSGWQKKYGVGSYSKAPGGISSLDVPEGLKIRIYSMENFGRIYTFFFNRLLGTSKDVKSALIRGPRNIRCLTSFSDNANFGNNGSITNWNDKIKSFKISYDELWDGEK